MLRVWNVSSSSSPSTTITVQASLDKDGLAFCRAQSEGLPIMTTGDFDSVAGTSTVNGVALVQLSGLVPVTQYDVYCIGESSRGVRPPANRAVPVTGIVRGVWTRCCKVLQVSLASSSVLEGGFAATGVLLSLQNAPSGDLTMTTSFNPVGSFGGSTALPKTVPSAVSVTRDAKSRSWSLGLGAGSVGTYAVSVVLSGSSASEFAVQVVGSAELSVLSSNTPPAAPVKQSAEFSHHDGV